MNRLTGEIPSSIGKLRWLETLDLSHNQLSGNIPQNFSSLTSLSHLNLSYNNLIGNIPSGNQLQTLDDPSIYKGFWDVCGTLVLKKSWRSNIKDDNDIDSELNFLDFNILGNI
ncbi:hypothetical protein L3X38_022494 [Prunus dulcis]|uniref:Uncharacterized protein n=1 Tax=Prunus dulcis TaxID=3755 RepID=A0AAD4Z4D0_PRUDU|nr:hypothetical protein L3X38_022494 [Prunus dulcis]